MLYLSPILFVYSNIHVFSFKTLNNLIYGTRSKQSKWCTVLKEVYFVSLKYKQEYVQDRICMRPTILLYYYNYLSSECIWHERKNMK